MLRAIKITKHQRDQIILDQLNVSLTPGKITALIGPNGSGKSTLLRSMLLLDSLDGGYVELEGELLSDKHSSPWPKVTGVFQQLFLWPHLTLRENIELCFERNSAEHFSEKQECLAVLIGQLALSNCIDRLPVECSLGERQRAAFIRAIILKPKYLLLDEITSALDVEQTIAIERRLADLRDQGTGILLITHQLGFAKRIAEEVIFLDAGKICESGGVEILSFPKTDRLKSFIGIS